MKNYQEIQNDIVLAIAEFIHSIDSSNDYRGDMSSLIQITSNMPLVKLDYWERLIRSELENNLYAASRLKWERWFKPDSKLNWLDIVNSNGYKRERTLRQLSSSVPNTFFLALAVRRLNDWVPQVRVAARHALPIVIQNTAPKCSVQVLSMAILRWHTWAHIESTDKALLLQTISHPDRMPQLVAYLVNATAGPIPILLAHVGRSADVDPYLNHIADNAVQPYVRAKAFRFLFEGRIFWLEHREFQPARGFYGQDTFIPIIGERKITVHVPLLDLLHRAANDPSSIVRKVAAEFVIRNTESLGIQAKTFAEKFAADKFANVAEQGRFVLRKLDEKTLNNS